MTTYKELFEIKRLWIMLNMTNWGSKTCYVSDKVVNWDLLELGWGLCTNILLYHQITGLIVMWNLIWLSSSKGLKSTSLPIYQPREYRQVNVGSRYILPHDLNVLDWLSIIHAVPKWLISQLANVEIIKHTLI